MARIYANTLDEQYRDLVQTSVLQALEQRPEARGWDVFILQIPGLPCVYVSVESTERVVKSWLFDDVHAPIADRIRHDL